MFISIIKSHLKEIVSVKLSSCEGSQSTNGRHIHISIWKQEEINCNTGFYTTLGQFLVEICLGTQDSLQSPKRNIRKFLLTSFTQTFGCLPGASSHEFNCPRCKKRSQTNDNLKEMSGEDSFRPGMSFQPRQSFSPLRQLN